MNDAVLTEVFMNESREIIGNLESDIVTLEENKNEQDIINRIFRYFHTLKGSSGIAGFKIIYEFTHHLESLFDKVRSGEFEVNSDIIDILLESIDWIKAELFTVPDESQSALKKNELTFRINRYTGTHQPEDNGDKGHFLEDVGAFKGIGKGERYFRINAAFKENIFFNGIDPLMIIEDLGNLGEVVFNNIQLKRIPDFYQLDPEKCYLTWELILKTTCDEMKIRDVFLFVIDDNVIEIENVTDLYTAAKEKSYLTEKKLG